MNSKTSMATGNDGFELAQKDAHVGASRVRPAEVNALLDQLEGWMETASSRRYGSRIH